MKRNMNTIFIPKQSSSNLSYTSLTMSSLNTSMIESRSRWFHVPVGTITPKLCKSLIISVSLFLTLTYLFFFFFFFFSSSRPLSYNLIKWRIPADPSNATTPPTNISHIFFGIATSSNTWNNRRSYIESWWRPNVTLGLVLFDRFPAEHLPWRSTSPPFNVSDDNSKYRHYNNRLFVIRLARVIEEAFNAEQVGGTGLIRWFVVGDDDTVFFVDNLVGMLSKYDHSKYYYIGMRSESIVSNSISSFEMGFGGAGLAMSYPLAMAVTKNMDLCIKRYNTLFSSDQILHSCISDLGVSLTLEKGFHQIDFHRDISGYLQAHPLSPILSLHHIDAVQPLFPSMSRSESLNHLTTAAKLDQSRLLQQSVCYYKKHNWTLSVSWGYSVQLYENILPPSLLYRPVETFIPWKKGAWQNYMFNTRNPSTDLPCLASSHPFFFASVDKSQIMNHVVTSYIRTSSPPACNRSAQHISEIRVVSPVGDRVWLDGSRRECCEVEQVVGMDKMEIKLRECFKNEIIA